MDRSHSHPAQADAVDYPLVTAFERFFSPEDPDDYLAWGGMLLLNELNCVACHEAGRDFDGWLDGLSGPSLREVGSRFAASPVALQLAIRNPRTLKRSTRMPSLFAGPDRDEGELDALFQYLWSLRETKERQPLLLGVVEKGRELFHQSGCVACHAPGLDYRPPGLAEEARLDLPGIPSAPIRYAEIWDTHFLTRFLMEPARTHPSGRMPGFGLQEEEAAHLAAYLQSSSEWQSPDVSEVGEDVRLAARGRELFRTKRCVTCHEVDAEAEGGAPVASAAPLRALASALEENRGCLSPRPQPGGVPYYYLSDLQRQALKVALGRLGQFREPDERAMVDMLLMQRDCYACHSWQGRGGPEAPREPYFGALSPYAPGRDRHLPPKLDGLRDRRTPEEILEVLTGQAPKRFPDVGARMVVLPPADAEGVCRVIFGRDN